MGNKLISVITVVYNDRIGLEKTIQSVLSQTCENIEYIIVDGGSTDGTIDVIKKYSDKIDTWVSEHDKGIYDAMNKGIKMAKGEWVNMMNSGDTFTSPDVLKSIFSENIPENISVLYSDHYICRNNKKILAQDDIEHSPYRFCHQSIIYRRKLHFEHGYYIVTNKLIISDSLFFWAIPDDEKQKVNIVIANYDGKGASHKFRFDIYKQNLCAELVYRKRTLSSVFWKYCICRIRQSIQSFF